MNPTSDDIRDLLESESIFGLILGTNLFVGNEPSTPINCVSIFDIPGYGPDIALDGSAGLYRPSFQLRVRHTSYLTGYSQIFDLMKFLHGKNHIVINDTVYELIVCVDDPHELAWDDSRIRFVCHFNVIRRENG